MSHKRSLPTTFRSSGDVRQKVNGGYGLYKGKVHLLYVDEDHENGDDGFPRIYLCEGDNLDFEKTPLVEATDPGFSFGGLRLGFFNTKDYPSTAYFSRTNARQYKLTVASRNVASANPFQFSIGRGLTAGYKLQEGHDGKFPSPREILSELEAAFKKRPSQYSLAFDREWAIGFYDPERVYLGDSRGIVGKFVGDRTTPTVQLLTQYCNHSLRAELEDYGLTCLTEPLPEEAL